MAERQQYWFAARRDGRAWGCPRTWQGWLVYVAWFVATVLLIPYLDPPKHPIFALAVVMGMVVLLAAVCYWKGEPLRGYRRE
jgi:peptidoglycan/LPS O-acetylase OafA/YrhL